MIRAYFVWVILLSVLSFCMFGIDKYCAVHKRWRIKERDLLWVSWIGGCFGAFWGMKVFHHKTLHPRFTIQIPVACVLWIGIGVFLFLR